MSTENQSATNSLAPAELPPQQNASAPDTSEEAAPGVQLCTWKSADLLGPNTEALILHRGQTYRLRCTKQGKLILYK